MFCSHILTQTFIQEGIHTCVCIINNEALFRLHSIMTVNNTTYRLNHKLKFTYKASLFTTLLPYMCQQQIYSQMSFICHICKFIQIQITGRNESIYASYELNGIDSMIRRNGIHKHYIIGICSSTNMSVALHIYVPLHCYCSGHINLTLLQRAQKLENASLLYHAAMYVPVTNLPPKFHLTKLVHSLIRQVCQYLCLIHTPCNQKCDQEHLHINFIL